MVKPITITVITLIVGIMIGLVIPTPALYTVVAAVSKGETPIITVPASNIPNGRIAYVQQGAASNTAKVSVYEYGYTLTPANTFVLQSEGAEKILTVNAGSDNKLHLQYFTDTSWDGTPYPAVHCTDVRVHVTLDNTYVGVTEWVGYEGGNPSVPLFTGLFEFDASAGTHKVKLTAQSRVSGCNTVGDVPITAWGGTVIFFNSNSIVTPEPDPDPDPDPDPMNATWANLRGINYLDPILHKEQTANFPNSPNYAFTDKFVQAADQAGFNIFRIPVNWESYEANPQVVLDQLQYIVKKADDADIKVWVESHHFYTTSLWGNIGLPGNGGFPKSLVECYKPTTTDYESDPEVRKFWNDFYNNNVRDRNNNCGYGTFNAWFAYANFMKALINKIDGFDNVIGYEVLNEPHVWETSHYQKLGDFHTYVGNKIKEASDRAVIFTRETAHGGFTRSTSFEPLIIPRVADKSNLIYAPHTYNLPGIERQVTLFNSYLDVWKEDGYNDIRIAIGEYATQPPQLPAGQAVTQENMDGFVSVWNREGWPHTYWQFGGFHQGEGNVLIESDGTLTEAGEYFKTSIETYYDTS